MPLEGLNRPSSIAQQKSLQNPLGNAWVEENQTSSDSKTKEVALHELMPGSFEPLGAKVWVDGQSPLQGVFKWEPFGTPNTGVTQDPFDQVQLYYSLEYAIRYLTDLGYDIPGIVGGKHQGQTHPISAHANKVADLNAWYSPVEESLTFGRGKEKWHLASDNDVSVHESGHLFLDHIHPGFGGWFGKEGGAIHEAFGDAFAALLFNDPEMSEDFAVALGRPPSKTDGLRMVNNSLTLDDVSNEVHDRGRVYAGFFWSVKENLPLPSGKAADLGLKLLFNHAANYKTARPTSQDFVEAVVKGAEALQDEGKLEVPPEVLRSIILSEARKRKFIKESPALAVLPMVAMTEVVRKFGGPQIVAFEKISQTPYLGGIQEKYQQYYLSGKFGKIPILGRGVLVNRKPSSFIPTISTEDGRKVNSQEINEEIKVTKPKADQLVLQKLDAEEAEISIQWTTLKDPPRNREEFQKLKMLEGKKRVIERSKEIFKTQKSEVSLVIYPDGKNLVYRFSLGYADCYVDALSGKVEFHQNIFY